MKKIILAIAFAIVLAVVAVILNQHSSSTQTAAYWEQSPLAAYWEQ